jgi:hypothetical protein
MRLMADICRQEEKQLTLIGLCGLNASFDVLVWERFEHVG